MELAERIELDISKFGQSMAKAKGIDGELSEGERGIIKLAKMYASDSRAFLEKGDLGTAFSSISYAHGLADAVLKLHHAIE